jgi:hypothetical protein
MNTRPIRQEEEIAIRQHVQDMQDAQNTKNGGLFASDFAPEHDSVAVNGMFLPNQTRQQMPAFTRGSTTRAQAPSPGGTGRWRYC